MVKAVKNMLPSLDNDRIIVTNDALPPSENEGGDTEIITDDEQTSPTITTDEILLPQENGSEENNTSETDDIKQELRVRLKPTHPVNTRYRGGFKFTYDEQILDISELSPEQLTAIKNDNCLIIKEVDASVCGGDE